MKQRELLLIAWLLGLAAACRMGEQVTAVLQGTQPGSPITGTATLTPSPNGLKIRVRVANVPPGAHGLHFHEQPDCRDGGKAAGGHYNPDGVKHGFLPQDGFSAAHAGDLGNIDVGPDGTGRLELTIPGLSLRDGPHSVAGRSIIVHEKLDDFGQPTGNAGGRIACGVITAN